jgi:V/A-type H+-transporting ATPase subunit D
MALMNVNPTRMELGRLKKRRRVAERGHKLMKDKRDEMVRRFILFIRRNKELRELVEEKLAEAMKAFALARGSMGDLDMDEALLYPAQAAKVSVSKQNILSIDVPVLKLEQQEEFAYPYGFSTTSSELDGAVRAFTELLPLLIELAEIEKTCDRLAEEIEKTRRRVNALEHVMIPQFTETIRYITM